VPKGARVIGLEIHLAGTFEGISNVPVGWHVSADNDPSGQASLEAHAKPGAAALDKSALLNLGLQVIENEVADERLQVWGWLILSSDIEKERRIPLNSYSFEFVERYPRHRLN
jgi:hypothetical protein